MAHPPRKPKSVEKTLAKPQFMKTPFGGVPAPRGRAKIHDQESELLPGRKALNQLAQGTPGQQSFQNFGRLSPVGSGALDVDFVTQADKNMPKGWG
jgi:hypothetical protein